MIKTKINSYADFLESCADGKCVLKISTQGCGPCSMVKRFIDEIEGDYPDVVYAEVDADECDPEILDRFKVRSVPVVEMWKDGVCAMRFVGMATKDQLKENLDNLYKN